MQFTHSRAHKKSSPDSQKSFSIFLEEKENAVYLNLSFSGYPELELTPYLIFRSGRLSRFRRAMSLHLSE